MKTKIFRLPPQRLLSPTFLKLHKNVQFVRMHKANSYAGTNMKCVCTDIKVSYCVRIGYGMGQIQMDIKGVAHHVRIGYDMGQIQMDIVFLLFKRF